MGTGEPAIHTQDSPAIYKSLPAKHTDKDDRGVVSIERGVKRMITDGVNPGSIIVIIVGAIVIAVVVFLLLREVMCWYWKINERRDLLSSILSQLSNIQKSLSANQRAVESSVSNRISDIQKTLSETDSSRRDEQKSARIVTGTDTESIFCAKCGKKTKKGTTCYCGWKN